MATLANIFHRFVEPTDIQESAATATADPGDFYQLRQFPNERIHLHVKRIDNTRVVRQIDPSAHGTCWRMIGGACLGALLLIGLLLPSAWSLLAGYQMQNLRQEQERLRNELAVLELQEARLLSPERLEELARIQQFIDPEPGKMIFLGPKEDLALNVPGR